jgi:leucine dehydrogenase
MSLYTSPAFDGHEQVTHHYDRDSGLHAIIAIHSTTRGPAFGGARCWNYPNEEAALTDALRLSRGMTLKNAAAELPLGGGKAVILLDAARTKTPAMMQAFGRAIEATGGRYLTAEDVGTSPADMLDIRRHTRYLAGLPLAHGGRGDPSPWTARGVLGSIEAALEHVFGDAALDGRVLAIQGLGNVGMALAEMAHAAGASLIVADTNAAKTAEAASRFAATVVPVELIHRQQCDVFVPCALGGVLTTTSVAELRASVVAGGANNQLATDETSALLHARGTLYVPDFIANAGGIIWIHGDYARVDVSEVKAKVGKIRSRVSSILQRAAASGRTPQAVALEYAQERVAMPVQVAVAA